MRVGKDYVPSPGADSSSQLTARKGTGTSGLQPYEMNSANMNKPEACSSPEPPNENRQKLESKQIGSRWPLLFLRIPCHQLKISWEYHRFLGIMSLNPHALVWLSLGKGTPVLPTYVECLDHGLMFQTTESMHSLLDIIGIHIALFYSYSLRIWFQRVTPW